MRFEVTTWPIYFTGENKSTVKYESFLDALDSFVCHAISGERVTMKAFPLDD